VSYTDLSAANLNAGFVVAIKIVAKEGEADGVASILKQLVAPSMAEPGMKYFMPYRSPADPSSFFVYELYENEAAWNAHNNAAHFKAAIVSHSSLSYEKGRRSVGIGGLLGPVSPQRAHIAPGSSVWLHGPIRSTSRMTDRSAADRPDHGRVHFPDRVDWH
jgi:quinol monooxygenase YgiN